MKRIFLFVMALLIIASLAGCGNGSDFQGIIHRVKESSITVVTDDVEPDTSYPVYEVFVDDQTEIKGAVNKLSKLRADQKVEIWVKGEWNKDPENKMVANKIIVSKK
ncbi:hypothetical protein GCM10007063_34250 [Lentibacillus kapialis]|uniref:DUF3221 domain-containing protein n=1 Tax=Lentibacillus kapialis TaxID=340214 RepID=A0A917Q356_9BACI|nr:hypothetical protein [Lentibacillus kapialis]GGK08956.1 hypothetical protein GCM10007063_34250 [Lentibacillus kapialis]